MDLEELVYAHLPIHQEVICTVCARLRMKEYPIAVLSLIKDGGCRLVSIHLIKSPISLEFVHSFMIDQLNYSFGVMESVPDSVAITFENLVAITKQSKELLTFLNQFEKALEESLPPQGDVKCENPRGSVQTIDGPNPFILANQTLATKDVKRLKDCWAAKQFRNHVSRFTSFTNLKIFAGTWNMAGELPVESLVPWLGDVEHDPCDIYVIGLQEVDLSTEAYLVYDQTLEMKWSELISRNLFGKYVKVTSKQLIGMLIFVFCSSNVKNDISEISTESIGAGILGMMGNKGAVAVRMRIKDSFLTFVNCHLAADKSMTARRNQDYQTISKKMAFEVPEVYSNSHEYYNTHPWVASFFDNAPSLSERPPVNHGETSIPFSPSSNTGYLSLFDTDHLIWFGDLNYRITLPEETTKTMILQRKFDVLLKNDQLTIERAKRNCFNGFEEAKIEFPPSYKYDIGTSNYDTSEKKRCPSWCDRILWKSNPLEHNPEWIKCVKYTSSDNMYTSDHKPVHAIFDVKIRTVDQTELQLVRKEVSRILDRLENEARPILEMSQNQFDFGMVSPLMPVQKTLKLVNIGKVNAEFQLANREGLRKWYKVTPEQGVVAPNSELAVTITLSVECSNTRALNREEMNLDDILIFHIEFGHDMFVSVTAKWQKSCFGEKLDTLCHLPKPANKWENNELVKLQDVVSSSDENQNRQTRLEFGEWKPENAQSGYSVPKEIWRLVDFIFKYGLQVNKLFVEPGNFLVSGYFQSCLDSGQEFNVQLLLADLTVDDQSKGIKPYSIQDLVSRSPSKLDNLSFISLGRAVAVNSAFAVLDLLLKSFPVPLVPVELQTDCVYKGFDSQSMAQRMIEGLPVKHYNTLQYLTSFMAHLCQAYVGQNRLTPKALAEVFAPLIVTSEYLKSPMDQDQSSQSWLGSFYTSSDTLKEQYHHKRVRFVQHLIESNL